MIRHADYTERFYLSKGDQIIYIDNCNIPLQHIDGIRFLYRQYKKKKAGVIWHTTDHNRNVAVLFVKAVNHLLDKPILVVCQDDAELAWLEQFQLWTNDVTTTDKPFTKKQILINNMSKLSEFCRRDWSLLIVDGGNYCDEVTNLPFKADYKIWITRDNMKKKIEQFSKIHRWFYPKASFDETKFLPDKNNLSEVLDKAILLDAFMEDIVFTTEEDSNETQNNQEDDPPPIRVSRKNKDATGTKIKRSKRKIYDDDDDDLPLSKSKRDSSDNMSTISEASISAITPKINNTNETREENNEINQKYDNQNQETDDQNQDINVEKEHINDENNTINSQSQLNLYYEPDASIEEDSDAIYDMNTQVLDNNASDNIESKYNDGEEVIDLRKDLDINEHNKTVDGEDNDSTKMNNNDDSNRNDSPTIFDLNSMNSDEEMIDKSLSISVETNDEKNVRAMESHRDTKLSENNESSGELPSLLDNLRSNFGYTNTTNTLNNEIMRSDNELVNNDEMTESNENEINKSENNDIDDKLQELEDKAMKKFKGSILDRLF